MSLRLLTGNGVRGRSYKFINLESIWGICRSSSDAEVVVRGKFDLAESALADMATRSRYGPCRWRSTVCHLPPQRTHLLPALLIQSMDDRDCDKDNRNDQTPANPQRGDSGSPYRRRS